MTPAIGAHNPSTPLNNDNDHRLIQQATNTRSHSTSSLPDTQVNPSMNNNNDQLVTKSSSVSGPNVSGLKVNQAAFIHKLYR
jgi:hypothetical protein